LNVKNLSAWSRTYAARRRGYLGPLEPFLGECTLSPALLSTDGAPLALTL
jgi:hypothetical protein